ncbi:hypothetical protein PoB_006016700 [Plakobranchus ocellatus]|uniref:Uncharacterized protein n=1 Tax=Plakobranchus ocellatus TaxID=259542 RepID=A0AAV4CP46_9GAST|nr:hypothetical protein PoB_006016700 [Plakobranchus ocellatus]
MKSVSKQESWKPSPGFNFCLLRNAMTKLPCCRETSLPAITWFQGSGPVATFKRPARSPHEAETVQAYQGKTEDRKFVLQSGILELRHMDILD